MPLDLIPHDLWMTQTAVVGRIRSQELKTVDDALRIYNRTQTDQNLKALRTAFDAWMRKPDGGSQSSRNRKGAVDKLDSQLNPRAATVHGHDLAHSRKGLLYLFANTSLDPGVMGFAKLLLEGGSELVEGAPDLPGSKVTEKAAGVAAKSVTVTIKALEAKEAAGGRHKAAPTVDLPALQPRLPVLGAHRTPAPTPETERSLFARFTEVFKEFVFKVWNTLKEKAGGFWRQAGWEKAIDIWSMVSKVAKLVVGRVAASALPFVSGGVDIVNGVIATVRESYNRWKSYSLGKGVELNAGHPGVVVESIEQAMNYGIGKGMYAALKGAASVTAAAFTGGASAIAMFVVSGCEVLAKLVYRIWEMVSMRAFFTAAGERYASGEAGYRDAADFKGWFRQGAYALPCVSALAINSGITGDKMMYVKMFNDRDEKDVISQAKFDQGVEKMDFIKAWSKKYLIDTGYEFGSKDAFVQALHSRTLSSKREVLTQLSIHEGIELP